MHYIIFDLEFNQDFQSLRYSDTEVTKCPYEVIQIGAIKADLNFETVATFNRFIKPTIYMQVSTIITDLTGISTDQLQLEEPFNEVFNDFIEFIGERDAVFCVWGISDMKELYRNVEFHKIDKKYLPDLFINLQPYASIYLNISKKKLLSLQTTVEALNLLTPYKFHNALYDAYYTAEIFKKIYTPLIQPKRYNPGYITLRPRQPKKVIDYQKLLQQFEKMYARALSEEEQDMILLAYKMGRTNQFITEQKSH